MARNISEAARKKLLESLALYGKIWEEQRTFMEYAFDQSDVPPGLGSHDLPMMATDLIYGRSSVFTHDYLQGYSEVLPLNYYGEGIGVEACTVIPMIKGSPVEVGPVARLQKYRKLKDTGTMALDRARLIEISLRRDRGADIERAGHESPDDQHAGDEGIRQAWHRRERGAARHECPYDPGG
jgi:coenzyme F420 hydrogenase subunit alpha